MNIDAAILEYLKDNIDPHAVELVSWNEEMQSDGYCETCYYEYIAVTFVYKDKDDKTLNYEYYGTLAELIRAL